MDWELPGEGLDERERRDLGRLLEGWDGLGEALPASVLKSNRLRTVWLVDRSVLAGGGSPAPGRWIVKQYRYVGVYDRLRAALFGGVARRERRALERLRALGFDAPRPLCSGELVDRGLPAAGGLVMEEIAAAEPLADRLAAGRSVATDPRAVSAGSRSLLVAFGRIVRALHDRGVHHPDLHGGNVLVEPSAPGRLHLIDVHSCRFPGRVPRFLRVRGLVKLAHSLATVLPAGELRWLLAAYLAPGGGDVAKLEQAAASGGALRDAVPDDGAALRLEATVRRRAARLESVRLRSRTARCLRSTTSFDVVRRRGERIHRARSFPVEPARDLARAIPAGELLKATRRGWVVRCRAAGREVVVKHRHLSPLERLASLLGRHRLRRAWVAGHGLRVRGLAAPLGLALVERRRLGAVECAWLIQEAVPDGEALDAFAWRTFGERHDAGGGLARARIALARETGALLRGLHDAGCRLHDASPQNVVVEVGKLLGARDRACVPAVAPEPGSSAAAEGHELAGHRRALADRIVWLVDLDDVTLGRRVPTARRRRNLVQLGNLPEGHVRAADRLRALRAYDAGDGAYYRRGFIAVLAAGLLEEAMRTIARMTRLELLGRPVEDAPGEGRVE